MSKVVLEVKQLTKNYKQFCAVNDLSLTLKEGQILGFIGPNGAGKSTTIECILGTKKYDCGTVEIHGRMMEKAKKFIWEEIGVQFQANFFPDRIRVGEMCEMMASLYETPANWRDLLHNFGLSEKVNQDVAKLSGGQRQKLSVLLALINQPSIVFLDELTTGLDPRARREIWKLLKNLQNKGLTIFLTSHYMDEVEYLCDEIIIFKEGKKVVEGTAEEIVRQSGKNNLEDAYLFYTGEEKEYESI